MRLDSSWPDFLVIGAVVGVVLEQVGQRVGAGEVIDGHDLQLGMIHGDLEGVAPMRPKPLMATL